MGLLDGTGPGIIPGVAIYFHPAIEVYDAAIQTIGGYVKLEGQHIHLRLTGSDIGISALTGSNRDIGV